MTCDECQDLLPLLVTGALEPGEEMAVRAHLAKGCPACAAELAAAEVVLHQLPLALPQTPPPASAWQTLESQISARDVRDELRSDADSDRAVLATPFTPPPHRNSFPAWPGWAAAAVIAIVAMVVMKNAGDTRDDLRRQTATLTENLQTLTSQQVKLDDQHTAAINAASRQIATMQQELSDLRKPAEFAVSSPTQPDSKGKVTWDKAASTLTVSLDGVKPLDAGKLYELWIVTSGGDKLAAGTATPDAAGKLIHTTNLPAGTVITAAAFTDEAQAEPNNGAKGTIQFLASLVKAP